MPFFAIFSEMTALNQPIHIQKSKNEKDYVNLVINLAAKENDIAVVLSNINWNVLDSKTTAKLLYVFYTFYGEYEEIKTDKVITNIQNITHTKFRHRAHTNHEIKTQIH